MKSPGTTRWRQSLLAAVWLAALGGCRSSTGGEENLLSIPVTSSMNVSVDEYNQKLVNLSESVRRTATPYSVLSEIWSLPAAARYSVMAATRSADGDSYEVVMVVDQVPDDDSVSGYRYDVKLAVDGRRWTIKAVKKSWRCWEGRGHLDFSIEPCS